MQDACRDWRDQWDYPKVPGGQKCCCACGNTTQLGFEPLFGYVVCKTHRSLPPVETNKFNQTI